MEYLEFDLDSAVATQTAIQGYASTDTPMFTMGRQIQNVVGFKIIETVIPASYFFISDAINPDTGYQRNRVEFVLDTGVFPLSSNNVFYITANRTYTATQLASEFQTQFQASGYPIEMTAPVTQTCTYSANTGKFTITYTSSAPVDIFTTSISIAMDIILAQMMGFEPWTYSGANALNIGNNTSGASTTTWSWVSPYMALTSGPNYINVNSKFFSSLVKNYLPQGSLGAAGESNTQICQVPMYTDFGGVSYWQDVQQDSFNLQNLFQINNFDLYLTLGTSTTPLVLNGIPWQCKIRIYLDTNTVSSSSAGNVDQLRVVRSIRQT